MLFRAEIQPTGLRSAITFGYTILKFVLVLLSLIICFDFVWLTKLASC